MPVVPKTDVALLDFATAHAAAWEPVADQIGLTADQVHEYKTLAEEARLAHQAAEEARLAAMAATAALRGKIDALRARSSALVKTIKAYDPPEKDLVEPDIYALAQIPKDAAPVAHRPPGTPEDVSLGLVPGGGLALLWRAKDASSARGAIFVVKRRVEYAAGPGEGGGANREGGAASREWRMASREGGPTGVGDEARERGDGYTVIGHAPGTTRRSRRLTFQDTDIPAGARKVSYILVPVRGTRQGEPSVAVSVELGGGGSGGRGGGAREWRIANRESGEGPGGVAKDRRGRPRRRPHR